MKHVFENKKKLYLATLLIVFLLSIILRLIPRNIGDILSYILFPIFFLTFTLIYTKYKKINYYIPIILTFIYLIIGYIVIQPLMSPLKVIISYLFSVIPLLIITFIYKHNKKKLEKEKEKTISEDKKKIVATLLPIITVILLEFYYSICTFDIARIPINFIPIIIGLIITYAFYYLLLLIFRKTSRANITLAILLFVIFIINEGRIYYTSDTLLLTDVLFLQNAGEVAAFADVTFFNCINFLLFPTILMAIIFIYEFKIAKKTNIKITDMKSLLIKTGVSVLLLVTLLLPIESLNKFIINNGFNIKDGKDLAITASNTRYFYRYGVLPGLYSKLIESRRFTPDNYDEKELTSILENTEKNSGTWKQPNIIVVFSESFWDVSKIDGIKFDKDVTPNFNRLKEEQKAIEMISPSYGGISSNVEFEILTGGSLNYFTKGYTPYMQLFHKGSENNPSIIQELKNNGYKTKVLNSSGASMFNCDYIYDFYGIDERNHLYDEIDLGGKYVTDAYLTDKMIEYFDNKPMGEKIFYFIITMGGHMPYYEGRYDNYDVNIVESPYDKEINEVVHSYAEGIYLADKELGRIYDYINTLDEDTIVVFFGDHLPHLSTPDGKDALFTTGFLDDDYSLESVYKQYNTTALILSNYDLGKDDTKYLSPDLLMTYVLNNMDLELSPFYRWLYTTKEVLPSSNYVVTQDNSGKIYYTLGLTDKMKEVYDLREKMQYMLFK